MRPKIVGRGHAPAEGRTVSVERGGKWCVPGRDSSVVFAIEYSGPGPGPRRIVVSRSLPVHTIEIVRGEFPAVRKTKEPNLRGTLGWRGRKLTRRIVNVAAFCGRKQKVIGATRAQIVQRKHMVSERRWI